MTPYRFHLADGQGMTLLLADDQAPVAGDVIETTCPWFDVLPLDFAAAYTVTAVEGREVQCVPVPTAAIA